MGATLPTVQPREGDASPGGRRARRAYLDNLKVVLVSAVIVAHVFITYGDLGSWAYREPSDNPAFVIPATLFVAVGSLFAMGLFFLIAGLLTPGALSRKGRAAFLKDRVVRLGLPFVVFLLLVYPAVEWAGEGGSQPLVTYLRGALRGLDPGPLWFVLVLLIYSVVFVAVRRVWPYRPRDAARVTSVGRFLLTLAAVVAVTTFLVRLWFPVDSFQVFALHLWQWPQCAGLFVLGTTAAERGWLDPVPRTLGRFAAMAAAAGSVVTIAAFAVSHDAVEPFAGGTSWQAFLTAGCEAVVAVGLSVWLLSVFQRRFDHAGPLARAAGRAAFGAYVLQAPVVVSLALAIQGAPLSPEVKALAVAPVAVAVSFASAWVLTRVPGVRRIV